MNFNAERTIAINQLEYLACYWSFSAGTRK